MIMSAKAANRKIYNDNKDLPQIINEILNTLKHDEFFMKAITARFEPIIDKAIQKATDKKHVRCQVMISLNVKYDLNSQDGRIMVYGKDAEIMNEYLRPLVAKYKHLNLGTLWQYKHFPYKKGFGNSNLIDSIQEIICNYWINALKEKGYDCWLEKDAFVAIYWGVNYDNVHVKRQS